MLFTKKDGSLKKTEQQTESLRIYRGNSFNIDQPKEWQDRTIHTLIGPIEDDIQHNILITIDENVPFDSLLDYADWQITAMEESLKGCRLLKREEILLNNGLPAYRAVFRWYPSDSLRVYQDHIFVLVDKTAYKLTTTFTKKTRKTLGPAVERILLSFQPEKASEKMKDGY